MNRYVQVAAATTGRAIALLVIVIMLFVISLLIPYTRHLWLSVD